MLNVLVSMSLVAMGLTWLYPFSCILRHGSHMVYEPSQPILIAEVALIAGLTLLGLVNCILLWRR